jgi:hypothetical protein
MQAVQVQVVRAGPRKDQPRISDVHRLRAKTPRRRPQS